MYGADSWTIPRILVDAKGDGRACVGAEKIGITHLGT
jgi:hypothetical protein